MHIAMIKVLSVITDGRIKAKNVLLELTIDDYLKVGEKVTEKNEFQRRRVRNTSTVYSLLRTDLKKKCTIPPIVLSVSAEVSNILKDREIEIGSDFAEFFNSDNIIILDGLQRTYSLIEVKNELKNDELALHDFLSQVIRVEVYVGLNKIGILYRMLTLNTGQTPMSMRHQIEILYSDYLDNNLGDSIHIYRHVEEKTNKKIGDFQFDDLIEGFNSYINRDASGIDRVQLLENIENLEKLSTENSDSNLFEDYVESYYAFLLKVDEITGHWKYELEEEDEGYIPNVFGRDIMHLFNRPQALSAFGAAIGLLKERGQLSSISDIKEKIESLVFTGEVDTEMLKFLRFFDKIKNTAKKIGVEQREFLKIFFNLLFNESSLSYLDFGQTIQMAYDRYVSLV